MHKYFLPGLFILIWMIGGCANSSGSSDPNNSSSQTTYLENKGSDTIVNLALAWAEEYQKSHQEIRISVTGGGSGTGIAALINGTVDIANASRQMKAEEFENAEANGIEPL